MEHSLQDFRIGFFIDGFTLKKVNEYYRYYHPFQSCLDFVGLKNWAKAEALKVFSMDRRRVSWESHYYHPESNPLNRSWHSSGIMRFEQQILDAGIQMHYCDMACAPANRPNMALMDDVMVFAAYRNLDAVVLMSTQGQFSSLPERLKSCGIPTLLLGWNFTYPKNNSIVHWKTDLNLKESSSYYVAMEQVADSVKGDRLKRCIFQGRGYLPKKPGKFMNAIPPLIS